ncbi:MAG: D-tyrosyl-tRNA(Tyr) deacylase [Candidatus Omnitrophica bacterium]|nr:D-tyrosyl-tRNA(Tyr) deacylase [Candidatus Omnitrophota bacterium]
MKILVTRVHQAEVAVGGRTVSSIKKGIAVFVGLEKGDDYPVLSEMAEKVVNLRIFENKQGKFHYSLKDKNYQIMCISNFTLCANTKKGRRPSFEEATPLERANKLFDGFILELKSKGVDARTGVFGEHMDIALDLDGPVNIVLESG